MATENIEMLTMDQVQELIKKAEQQSLEKAKQQVKAELKAEQLEKDTTELIKSYDFVPEGDVQSLVKAMTTVDANLGAVMFKAFDNFHELMKSKDQELEEIRKAFGERNDSIEGTPSYDKRLFVKSSESRTQELEEIVKAKLAAQQK